MEKRVYGGIEICRLFCSLAVIVFHYPMVLQKGLWNEADRVAQTLPLYGLYEFFYLHGDLAVPVFWVISGFIFFWRYAEKISNNTVSGYQFFVARFSRLYPLHFITLVMVGVLQSIYVASHKTAYGFYYNDTTHFLTQLLFVSNWFRGQNYSFNFPIWSVSAEILVYALFFVFAKMIRPTVAICILTILASKALAHFVDQPVLRCFLFFFTGGLIQIVISKIDARFNWVMLTSSGASLAAIALIFGVHYEMLLASALVIFFVYLGECLKLKEVPLANATYSSYLLHFPLQLIFVLICDRLGYGRDVFLIAPVFLAYLVTTYSLGYLVYVLIELIAQRKIRSWLLGTKRSFSRA